MSLVIQQYMNALSTAAAQEHADQFKPNVKWTLQTLQTNVQTAAAVSKLYSNMYILSKSSF